MISERIGMLKGKRSLLLEQRASMLSRYDSLVDQIDLAERAKPYFLTLKDATDQDVVKLYSELLTSIVHDVMEEFDQEVILSTSVVRNKTTLDIKTVKNGATESIDDGRGGSISNLISAGLRFIALYKSSNRRFIILDEPECWLAPHLIPRFVSVIERMSDLIGIQTVLISHHASDVISSQNSEVISIAFDKSNKLSAIRNEKPVLLNASLHSGVALTIPAEEEYKVLSAEHPIGITTIRLVNVQSHSDTVVELGRGLTVINGNNDIGKSVVARSFSALMLNDYKDALIKHDEDSAHLEVETEQGTIKWSFKRKAKYSLYQFIVKGEVSQEQDCKRGEVPTFLNEILCMPLVNGINIHIADQRDPLFILHPSHTPAARAEMLNLGDSFKQLQIMMQLHDEKLRESRKTIKTTKEQMDEVNDRLFYLSNVDVVDALNIDVASASVKDVVGLKVLMNELSKAAVVDQYESALALLSSLCVESNEDNSHQDILTTMQSESSLYQHVSAQLSTFIAGVDAMPLYDTHPLLIEALTLNAQTDTHIIEAKVEHCLSNIAQINTRILPELNITELSRLVDQQYQQEQEVVQLEEELEKLLELQSKIQVCPSCGQRVGEAHHDASSDIDFEYQSMMEEPKKSQSPTFDIYY